MGDFKRDSSRFSRGGNSGSNGGGQSRGGFNRGGSAPQPREQSQQQSGGFSRGGNSGYQGRGNSNGGGQQQQGEFAFTRIADMSVLKSASNDERDYAEKELKGSGLRLSAKVYLGKGDDKELVLRSGDMLLIEFKNGKNDKDFVIGKISIKN